MATNASTDTAAQKTKSSDSQPQSTRKPSVTESQTVCALHATSAEGYAAAVPGVSSEDWCARQDSNLRPLD